MPQLLLELFSEEIPARMQGGAQRDLERLARERLAAAQLGFERIRSFAGPRRLTLVVDGLPAAQADRTEERKGPRVGAPEPAIAGFLRSAGVERDQLTERDGVWFATIARAGRPTGEIIAEMVEAIVRGFPWPKSMTSGVGRLRWVRPLQRILCVFDREIVALNIEGIVAADLSEGHRFMGARQPFRARDFDEYREALAGHFVVLDAEERAARILAAARELCRAQGLELVDDDGLLDELAGLAEWPTPLLGDMDPAFLDLPPEVIRTSMRTHQKYFAVANPDSGELAPRFVVVANIEASDGGALVAAGNARVLSARLKDARFFWDEDRKAGFDAWLEKLKGVTFHAKLGTMAERVERITALARQIAPLVGADPDRAAEAARLAKADLASAMVGEFPELQGVMGGYYARAAGLDDDIAAAIGEHYRPQGPSDQVPTAPVSVAVALADRLDMLVGFFAIDEKPTGSRDRFALRRAALGIVRTVLERELRFGLRSALELCVAAQISKGLYAGRFAETARKYEEGRPVVPKRAWEEPGVKTWVNFDGLVDREAEKIASAQVGHSNPTLVLADPTLRSEQEAYAELLRRLQLLDVAASSTSQLMATREFLRAHLPGSFGVVAGVLAFLAERLKVQLREQGARHDLVDAVFALGDDDLVRVLQRVEALDRFLDTNDGINLLSAHKRASNILLAESERAPPEGAPKILASSPIEEVALIHALANAEPKVDVALEAENFTAAMHALAALREPVDAFFDNVLVNSEVEEERANRLRLLSQIQATMDRVAAFSLVSATVSLSGRMQVSAKARAGITTREGDGG